MTANPLAPDWLVHPVDANALDPGVWPSSASRGSSGAITLGGIEVSALAAEFGTPLFVVDELDVRARAEAIRVAFSTAFAAVGGEVTVYYAGKAFLSTEIARWMIAAGLNIDVCSGGELAVAMAAGVDPARLGFHGNNKSQAEIVRSVELGVGAIVLDSVVEVERVAAAARANGRVQPVRLRINSGVHASTHDYLATAREDQKFGIPLADAAEVVARIRSHDSLRFLGLHSHIGSQIFESDGFAGGGQALAVAACRVAGRGRGARAQPGRRLRYRLHERGRGDPDRADRRGLRPGRGRRMLGPRDPRSPDRHRTGPRCRWAEYGHALRGRYHEGRAGHAARR